MRQIKIEIKIKIKIKGGTSERRRAGSEAGRESANPASGANQPSGCSAPANDQNLL